MFCDLVLGTHLLALSGKPDSKPRSARPYLLFPISHLIWGDKRMSVFGEGSVPILHPPLSVWQLALSW